MLSDVEADNKRLEQQIEEAQLTREDTSERKQLIEKYDSLLKEKKDLEAELYEYRKVDPDNLKKLEQQEKIIKEEVNYYTDNIYEMKRWLMEKNPGFNEQDLMNYFEIPEDMDNV